MHLIKNVKRVVLGTKLGYHCQLWKRGARFQPNDISGRWMNTALKAESEWRQAKHMVVEAGLPPHPDGPKNWDSAGACSKILSSTSCSARVLDAGGAAYSPLVDWLYLYGYSDLHVINLEFEGKFRRGPIRYYRGNCADTAFPSSWFDAVACLSVIEHGVDVSAFVEEAWRLLRPGGLLIISTDYWERPVDTKGLRAYGAPVRVFSRKEIVRLIEYGVDVGFLCPEDLELSCRERAVRWSRMNLEFTFCLFCLKKPRSAV